MYRRLCNVICCSINDSVHACLGSFAVESYSGVAYPESGHAPIVQDRTNRPRSQDLHGIKVDLLSCKDPQGTRIFRLQFGHKHVLHESCKRPRQCR